MAAHFDFCYAARSISSFSYSTFLCLRRGGILFVRERVVLELQEEEVMIG